MAGGLKGRLLLVPIATMLVFCSASAWAAAPADVLFTKAILGWSGRYALPDTAPTQLVVMGHGHGNSSKSWIQHLQQAAARGAVAIAPDYRGKTPEPENHGWNASAGAQDLVSSAKYFLRQCPSIKQVFLFGISMGGHITGVALLSNPRRADGTPLFDYWVDVEGVNNWIEEYWIARGVAPVNAGGALAQQEIENETGGPIESKSSAFTALNLVNHGDAIKASGVRGVVLVHSIEDGLVPYDQSVEMSVALRANQEPTDFYSVLRRTSDRDAGHQQSSILGIPGAPLDDADPFAGHGWEGSSTQLTVATGFKQLWSLMDSKSTKPSGVGQNFLVDSGAGTLPSDTSSAVKVSATQPSTAPCTAAGGVMGVSTQVAGTPDLLPNTGRTLPPGVLLIPLGLIAGLLVRRHRSATPPQKAD